MEGYTNVCGNHEDFDNLDIEGRIPSKDIAVDEKLLTDQLLSIKVRTYEGNLGHVFTVSRRGLWQCHLCDTHFAHAKHVKTHLGTKVHLDKMALGSHPDKMFTEVEKVKETAPQLAYGEPVPPGMEDEMSKEALIKVLLDSHTDSPLIGLEYIVELQEDEKEPNYYCTLCMKSGDPRVIITHLAGIIHKNKYLAINFPKVSNRIQQVGIELGSRRLKSELINFICAKIGDKHGRGKPIVMDKQRFESDRSEIIRNIAVNHHHARETPTDPFLDMLTPELIESLEAPAPEEKVAEPPVEKPPKPTFKPSFPDAKIGCDRSKLRMRKEDSDDDIMVIEQEKANNKDKSPLTVSSVSSDSMSSVGRGAKPRRRTPVRNRRSRSKSRSPRRRSRSPFRVRRSPVPRSYHHRRSRSRSPYHRHLRSPPRRYRSRSPYNSHKSKSGSYERRSRSPSYRTSDEKYKSSRHSKQVDNEKTRWVRFRQAVDQIEKLAATKLEYYEQHPEKHPEYTPEWKKFWTHRYKEVQAEGKDPERHDFKKEWAAFWTKRVRELQEETVAKHKDELKKQLGLTEKKPPTKPKVEERPSIKSRPDDRPSRKPHRKSPPAAEKTSPSKELPEEGAPSDSGYVEKLMDAPSDMVYTLRLLTALENLLGSLGPQVNSLLATALSLEKATPRSSQTLLKDNSVVVLLETVSEKLKGLLLAGIVADNLVAATRRCISCLSEVLKTVPATAPNPIAQERAIIASQIAAALVAQGKHDVTEEQLEALVNTVIGMAQSSKQESSKSMGSSGNAKSALKPENRGTKASDAVSSGLQLLQSAYKESKQSATSTCTDNLEDLTEEDLRVLLRNFNELSSEEQQGLIDLLKKMEMTNPQKVERLRKYVVIDPNPQPAAPVAIIRKPSPLSLRDGGFNNPSPKEIPKKFDSDSDDDYNFMDILAAASKNVKESEQKKKLAEKKEQDAALSLREIKERVASMLGPLPPKPTVLQKPASATTTASSVPAQQKPYSTQTATTSSQQQSRYNYSTDSTTGSTSVPQQQPRYKYPENKSPASSVPVPQQQSRYSYPADTTTTSSSSAPQQQPRYNYPENTSISSNIPVPQQPPRYDYSANKAVVSSTPEAQQSRYMYPSNAATASSIPETQPRYSYPGNAATASSAPEQSRYSYPGENPRYAEAQPSVQNMTPVKNVTGYAGHQQMASSAPHAASYANQHQMQQQQQWNNQNYHSSVPQQNPHHSQPYSQYAESYPRQQYY